MSASQSLALVLWSLFVVPLIAQAPPVAAPAADLAPIQELIQQHRFFEARTAAQGAIAAHPRNVEAYNLLGIIDSAQKNYGEAATALQQALKIAPNSTKTRNNLGNIYVAEGQPELAEKEFRAVLRLDPLNRDANYNLGLLLLSRGAAAEAVAHFEHVRPQTSETRLNLIRAYFAGKLPAQALRAAEELSSENKNDLQVHFSLGLLLASAKQYDRATLEFERADALSPDTFEILFNLGQALMRSGKSAEAGQTLSRALKLKPDSADTLYLMAQVAVSQAHPLDALDLLIRARKLAPQNPDIVFLMAQVSMSQNYFEDAIPLLESGLQIAPRRPDLVAALGESYFMAGKVDKAVDEFKLLVDLEGSARSYAFLGLAYRNLGRFDEAKQYFQKGLRIDAHSSLCLYNLGFIAERQGDAVTAGAMFEKALLYNPRLADAIIELANLRVAGGKAEEGIALLRKYVQVATDPAPGYYKLAMVERTLHRTADAERDLSVFKTLSKNSSSGPLPYQHLFDYLDNRSRLAPGAQAKFDLNELTAEVTKHPGQPEDLYLLAEGYLKAGDVENAKATIAQLDQAAAGDFRTLTGEGVLLARFHLYDDAIQHFKAAMEANPKSTDVKFDLADAYFHKRLYNEAREALEPAGDECARDSACQALLGDIYGHLGDTARAETIFKDVIQRNPDDDQAYLSLAVLDLKQNNVAAARQTLSAGLARIPSSGKLSWGMGLADALQGDSAHAAGQFERAVDLLPEWPGGYSLLGVFYFETGQIAKAREVLDRFKNSSVSSSLDIGRIEQVLDRAPDAAPHPESPLTEQNRAQLLAFALSLADRTL